jgi:phosphatidylglycerol:prolipoprotein diacylglycerol transferase
VIPLVITMPLDPVLRLGPVPVHWYGVGYAVAFLVGIQLITPFLERRGLTRKTISDLVWWNIGVGLVGARLYFVIQQPDLSVFVRSPIRIIAVWEGGMAFFGAVIACLATVVVFAYVRKLSVWLLLDAGAIFATLPQAIGRIGNIINGDILGPPSNLPWAVRYTNSQTFAPHLGVSYQPAGAYELLVALALFGLVMLVLSRRPPDGAAVAVYLTAYAGTQFLLFFVRATEPVVLFGLKQAQLTSLVILLLGVPLLIALRLRFPDIFTPDRAVAGPGHGGGPGDEVEVPAGEPEHQPRQGAAAGLAKEAS